MKKSDLTKLIAIGAAVTAAAATTAIVISKHKKHKTMLAEHTKTLTKKQAYITGGGLSAFASALYLVRDCGFTPENIHIFTNGTRDCGNNETGFICRRGKTISIKDSMNFFDLISDVDSLDIPDLTVCDEILNIYLFSICLYHFGMLSALRVSFHIMLVALGYAYDVRLNLFYTN